MVEVILDGATLIFMLIGMLATYKVFRSRRDTPDDWVGPQAAFAKRIVIEQRWFTVCWVSFILAAVIGFLNLLRN